ncbi:hypothetical protein [Curtobacterium sp. 9128]|uniref:hypothetical protein n=1 Tax=Curtobacterium sp. 9128 TaxID=1793722 RepID=UPI00119CCD74|nr:hypothetical protein [Curtobacterium sp. 9128]
MITFVELTKIEVLKRLDTAGAAAGFGVLALLIVVCGGFSVSLITKTSSFNAGEVIVTAGLPAALAASIVGVVVGVGDASRGGERDGLLAGLTRDAIYWGRFVACGAIIAGVIVFTALVGSAGALVGVALGGHLSSWSIGASVLQVAALCFSSAAFGFGIGASLRSLALGLVTVLGVMLVLDVVLAFLGSWTAYIRFGSVQNGMTGEGEILATITSGLIWIVLPVLAGWLRTRTVAP